MNYGSKFNSYIGKLNIFSGSIKILVESLEPPNIVMRVGDNMNGPWVRMSLKLRLRNLE